MRRGICAVVVICMLACAAPTFGQSETGTLTITVKGIHDEPAARTAIEAGSLSVLTDEQGHATLQLNPGEAEIRFHSPGLRPKVVHANVISGDNADKCRVGTHAGVG